MTKNEFDSIDWQRGNVVRLNNGKEYFVKGTKCHGKYLLLYSEEYDKCFVVDHQIVNMRTSDYVEPEEVYLEHKRLKKEAIQARVEAERQEAIRIKEERKRRNIEEQERIHQEAVARKAAQKLERQKKQEEAQAAKAAAKMGKTADKPKVAEKPAKVEVPKVEKPKVEAPKVASTKVEAKPVVAAAPVAPKADEPATDAPRKRVRQRIKVTTSTREKVEYFKKK